LQPYFSKLVTPGNIKKLARGGVTNQFISESFFTLAVLRVMMKTNDEERSLFLKSHPAPNILLLGTLFGTTLVASRFSVGLMSPLTYVGLRLALASLLFVIIYVLSLGGRTWPRDPLLWRRAVILGVFGTAIPMFSFTAAMQYQSSGVTSVLITVSPALTAVLAHFMLPDEHLDLRKATGVACAFLGALILAIRGESGLPNLSKASPIGYGLVFFAITCTSSMNIFIRKKMRDYPAFDVAAIRILTAALLILPLSVWLSRFNLSGVSQDGWMIILYAAVVGTFFAMLLDFANTQRFGATVAVMVTYVIPIVTLLIGALLLNETITIPMLIGMGFIVVGVWLITRK
jgi:drug/metabolite transporter (DMT)-like permease